MAGFDFGSAGLKIGRVSVNAVNNVNDLEMTAAFAAARAICRRHARSFYFASFFLPGAKRRAAYAIYAFCRLLDDAVDIAEEVPLAKSGESRCRPGGVQGRIAIFNQLLDAVYANAIKLPAFQARSEAQHAMLAFQKTVQAYAIPQQHFLMLAKGCGMDLTIKRYQSWADLEDYCYHVAGVVGLIMSSVFGLQHEQAREQAVAMGNAMQLTNILRDVQEDSMRGRIYLPLEDLARFGYSEQELAAGVVNDSFKRLMKFEVARARAMYREGSKGLCWLANDGSRLTASAMAVIYSGILDAIEHRHYDVFGHRAHLSIGQKLKRLPASWRLARREEGQALPRVF